MKRKALLAVISLAAVGGVIVLSAGSLPGASMRSATQSTPSSSPPPEQDRLTRPATGLVGSAGAPETGKSIQADSRSPAGASAEQGQGATLDRMIVYNTSIALAVESVPESVNAITALAEGSGGYVAGASLRYQEEKELATLTLKVPASAFGQVMNALRKMAVKVSNETGSTRDVTEEFSDLAAQLRNYEATEAQYLELLKRANTIDEILKVQARLTEVRGQIERTRGRMNLIQRTADMATIAVSLAPAVAVKEKERLAWDPSRSVREAWEQSLALVQALADVSLRVAVFSWWLAPPALLAWGAWAALRRPQRDAAGA